MKSLKEYRLFRNSVLGEEIFVQEGLCPAGPCIYVTLQGVVGVTRGMAFDPLIQYFSVRRGVRSIYLSLITNTCRSSISGVFARTKGRSIFRIGRQGNFVFRGFYTRGLEMLASLDGF